VSAQATGHSDLARVLADLRHRVEHGDIDTAEAAVVLARLQVLRRSARKSTWDPYPWQVPPGPIATMGTWLMLGGRGTGKTDGGSHYVDEHAMGPPCDPRLPGGHRMAIVAPTLGDASESCVTGPSGLQTINPGIKTKGGIGGAHLTWPNGATARLFGAYTPEDVERLRAGGNRCLVWMEEAAAMRHLDPALEHTSLGLRIGDNPHYVMSTTPKPRRELKRVIDDPRTMVTRGSTRDAYHLDREVRRVLFERYEGTRLGRQELDAELLTDVEGALWSWAMIDDNRVPIAPPNVDRVVVAVDPGGT
jgi:phage terminase large subunit-like protein